MAKDKIYLRNTFIAECLYKCNFCVPAVVDVEVGSHNRSTEHTRMSPCYSVNHGGYRPPVDMTGNTEYLVTQQIKW